MPSQLPDGDAGPAATGRCRSRRWRGSGSGRSASTCTCRSAPSAAATATSTPTPRRSSGTPRARRGRRTPRRRSPSSGWPGGCWATGTCRCPPSSSAEVRRPCCRPRTWRRCSRPSTPSSGSPPDAEVTTESNPDSVDADDLARLREAGFTRISFGMQSAVPHVLAMLDRTHDPRAGAGGGRVGARRRLRAGQPGPDLRHAGGVAGRLARPPSTPRWPAGPTTCRRTR